MAKYNSYNKYMMSNYNNDNKYMMLNTVSTRTLTEGHGAMVRAQSFVNVGAGFSLLSLPVGRFRIPLGAGFSEKYHVSPFSILEQCLDVVSLEKTLDPQMLDLTQVKMDTW